MLIILVFIYTTFLFKTTKGFFNLTMRTVQYCRITVTTHVRRHNNEFTDISGKFWKPLFDFNKRNIQAKTNYMSVWKFGCPRCL